MEQLLNESNGRSGAEPAKPKEWANEQLVYGYFQAFKRPRAMDPAAYDAKLLFWRRLLLERCALRREAVLCARELRPAFQRYFEAEQRTLEPTCFGTVLAEMRAAGALCAAAELNSGRLWRAAAWTASWTWRALAGAGAGAGPVPVLPEDEELVVREAADTLLQQALRHLSDAPECVALRPVPALPVLLKTDYEAQLAAFLPHAPTRRLVDALLRRAGHVRLEQFASAVELVYLPAEAAAPALSVLERRLLEGAVKLRAAMASLEREEVRLREHLRQRKAQAKTLLLAGRREEALGLMRRSASVLANLEAVLLSVETAESDTAIVAALAAGGGALRDANAGSAANVGDALAAARDALAEQEELRHELEAPAPDADQEEALEAELAALLLDESAPAPGVAADEQRVRQLQRLTAQLDAQFAELDAASLPDVSTLPLPSDSPVAPVPAKRAVRPALRE